MKHELLLACLILSITLAISACGSDDRESADYIGIESAKGIALRSAGLSSDQAEFTTAGLDKKDDIFYYQICFSSDGNEYEYAIDALTGVVIQEAFDSGIPVLADGGGNPSDSSMISGANLDNLNLESGSGSSPGSDPDEAYGTSQASGSNQSQDTGNTPGANQSQVPGSLSGSNQSQTTGNPSESNHAQVPGSPSGSAQTQTPGSNSGSSQPQSPAPYPSFAQPPANTGTGTIDEQQARDIAITHSGISSQDISKIEVKQDDDDVVTLYKVKFRTNSNNEYEYKIDRSSGRIISFDHDLDDHNLPAPQEGAARIDQSQAMAAVLARVPGASNSDISIKLEEDDGRLEYKGRIKYDGMEYKFKLDAYSGALTEWEAEPED